MYNPCYECWNRYGKEYTKECDTTCEFAKFALENTKLKEILKTVYKINIDIFEDEEV